MVDQILQITFVYDGGDADSLLSEHKEHLHSNTRFQLSPAQVSVREDSFGSIGLSTRGEVDHEYEPPSTPYVEYVQTDAELFHIEPDEPIDIEPMEPLEDLAELVVEGYNATERRPVIVYGLSPQQHLALLEVGRPPVTEESLAENRLEYLSWLQILPPAIVETYGRERLLSAPAWRVEELKDGAILLICHADTEWWAGEEEVAEYLGIDAWSDVADE